jgi:hypothetical protein
MNRTIVCFCGLASLVCSAPAYAELRFTTTEAKLGDIRGGTALTHVFPFFNNGAEPVHVLEARASCGCLQPRLEKLEYAAGEEGKLWMAVRTLGQAGGTHTWTAHVRYRAGGEIREAALRVSANIINEVTVQPAALTLVAEGALGQDIVLTDTRSAPLAIREVRASFPHLLVRVVSQQQNDRGHLVGRIHVAASSECPAGRHEAIVSIYTQDPMYPQLQVPVTLVKQAARAVSVKPASLVFHDTGQAIASRLVRISAADQQAVVIESVSTDHPALACTWAPGPGPDATVKVQVHRGKLGSEQESVVHIHLRSPQRQVLTVPVSIVDAK